MRVSHKMERKVRMTRTTMMMLLLAGGDGGGGNVDVGDRL